MSSIQSTLGNPQTAPQTAGGFVRHRGPVTSVAGIPGRRAAISTGYDAAVGFVDLENGTLELMGYHDHLVNTIRINRSGTRAASSSSDHTICIWDLENRKPLRLLRGHGDDVNDFAFIDDHTGASVSHDHRVFVWDLETGAIARILEGHEKYAMSVDYADGKIYSAGDDMTLRQWDAKTGELVRKWGPFEVETDTCAIDSDRGRVILGADDGCIRIFDSASGDLVCEVPAHSAGIKKISISPANGYILSAAYDQRLLVWDAQTFELRVELQKTPATWERSLNWTPDGGQILAGTFDGTVLVWDAATGDRTAEIGAQGEVAGNACLNDIAADANGELALASDDGYVRLGQLTPSHAELRARVEPSSGRILMNAITMDGDLVAAGAHNQKLHIFHKDGGQLLGEVEVDLQEGPINTVRISRQAGHEGESYVGCYSGAVVRVASDGTVRGTFRLNDGAVKALRLHPTRPIGISASADGGVVSWTLEGEPIQHFRGHVAIANDVDLDPTGERFVSVSRDFTLKVFEVDSGRLLHSAFVGNRSPKSVCFWDLDTVIVGNYWGRLLRFDLTTGKNTWARIAQNGISSVTRAGDHLMAASYDGSVYLVDPADLRVVNTLTTMVQKLEGGLRVSRVVN